jgi:hypothetical protein
VIVRGLALGGAALLLAACAMLRPPVEQRVTQGPTAEQFWMLRVLTQNGQEPSFEERRYWNDQMELRIDQYLRAHPETANTFEVSTFRFFRQVAVGQTKEQVLILLGPPEATTTDAAELEKLARRYWPNIKGNATEAWVYPLGWNLYFAGQRLVDITQYLAD